MNIVFDNTIEEVSETERNEIGLVVRRCCAAHSRRVAKLTALLLRSGDPRQQHRDDGVFRKDIVTIGSAQYCLQIH